MVLSVSEVSKKSLYQMTCRFHQIQAPLQSQKNVSTVRPDLVSFLPLALFPLFSLLPSRHFRPIQCLCGLSATNCFIHEPLALHAAQDRVNAFGVTQSSLDQLTVNFLFALTVGVTEIEFSSVAVKVRSTDMMVGADNAALEDGEDTFDSVGMHVAANILASLMVNSLMSSNQMLERAQGPLSVSHEVGLSAIQLSEQNRFEFAGINSRDMEGTRRRRHAEPK